MITSEQIREDLEKSGTTIPAKPRWMTQAVRSAIPSFVSSLKSITAPYA